MSFGEICVALVVIHTKPHIETGVPILFTVWLEFQPICGVPVQIQQIAINLVQLPPAFLSIIRREPHIPGHGDITQRAIGEKGWCSGGPEMFPTTDCCRRHHLPFPIITPEGFFGKSKISQIASGNVGKILKIGQRNPIGRRA